jgi:hypothetical protein
MSHCLTRRKLQELEPGTTSERPLYTHRRLADGHPGLDRLAFDRFSAVLEEHGDETPRMDTLLERLNRLVDLDQLRDVVVIGCGPKPQTIKLLAQRNYNVVGVEPVPLYVESAREYIGSWKGPPKPSRSPPVLSTSSFATACLNTLYRPRRASTRCFASWRRVVSR